MKMSKPASVVFGLNVVITCCAFFSNLKAHATLHKMVALFAIILFFSGIVITIKTMLDLTADSPGYRKLFFLALIVLLALAGHGVKVYLEHRC